MSSSFEKVTRPDSDAMEMGGPEGEGVAASDGVAGRRGGGPWRATWLQPVPRIATVRPMSATPRPFMPFNYKRSGEAVPVDGDLAGVRPGGHLRQPRGGARSGWDPRLGEAPAAHSTCRGTGDGRISTRDRT